jgi:hypothetical protein
MSIFVQLQPPEVLPKFTGLSDQLRNKISEPSLRDPHREKFVKTVVSRRPLGDYNTRFMIGAGIKSSRIQQDK